MRPPLYYLLLLFLILVLMLLIQIGIFRLVLDKLGLDTQSATLLLVVTLIGSAINLPLFKIRSDRPQHVEPPPLPPWLGRPRPYTGVTLIAINVGGALVPLMFSLYLMLNTPLYWWQILIAIATVSAISYRFSRPVPGLGIGMPIFVAPLAAAITALLLAPDYSAPLAYICGTLGVLIGADVLRLKDIPQLATPVAAIGGAGTFDGIFFTGIIAVILA